MTTYNDSPSNRDDDDYGNVGVCDDSSSYNLKSDDDGDIRRYWNKNDGVMTI